MKKEWKRGDKALLARKAGISPSYLSDIMADRKQCRPYLARLLAQICHELGYNIPRTTWAFPEERKDNPLFK